jgi:hypothetical protein
MARSRNIKPGFFTNEELVELDFCVRLLFIGLWTLCDREGRMEDRPKKIKMALFPADNIDIEQALNDLASRNFIIRYEADGNQYIQVVNFGKHQNPHVKEPASTIPAPCKSGARTVQATLIPDSPLPITDSRDTEGDANACPVSALVALYHECMPDNPKCKVLNDQRRGMIKARWNESRKLEVQPFGFSTQREGLNAWKTFFEVCNESSFLTGRSTPTQGKPPFLADIDFLFSPSGFAKCLENKYHREATNA